MWTDAIAINSVSYVSLTSMYFTMFLTISHQQGYHALFSMNVVCYQDFETLVY